MARRIFLDVGGHIGETLQEVTRPRWHFDRVFTFEPASACVDALRAIATDKTVVVPAGWWSSNTSLVLHDPGSIGASIAGAKATTELVEQCSFIDAAQWMDQNIADSDRVWLKLNCEGAECEVLNHLLDRGQLQKVAHLLIHFDVEKIPGMEDQAKVTRERLRAAAIPCKEARHIMFGRSHAAKTANWLFWTESQGFKRFRYSHVARLTFRARQRLYPLKLAINRHRPRD